jgi:glucose/arabinose dehydrogenase
LAPTDTSQPVPTSLPPDPTSTQIPTPTTLLQFPDPAGYEWRLVISGLQNAVGMANAGDGSGRLFILEQPGRIRIAKDGALLPEPFLDIVPQVDCCGERGLLGLAFHPDYETNGFFYTNYIDLNGDTVIARFRASQDPDRADANSEFKIMGIDQPYPNHNGGSMVFGPDGYLYLGLGDGGSGGDPLGNGQNPNTLLGKILRLDINSAEPYAIPPENPFNQGNGAPEVWAWGLRNPWRFSFDRLTGDVYIGDVGQSAWEEIDYLPAGSPGGANFGWNYREGLHPFARNEAVPPADLVLIDPVAEYGHDQGISVTGGYVYRGEKLPEWNGIYLYGDYGSGFVWGLLRDSQGAWQNRLLFQTGSTIASFGEDEQGEIYLVDHQGDVYRLERK